VSTAGQAFAEGQFVKKANPRPYSFAGYVIILITFGIFGIWAYFSVISSAVVASGVVSLEGNRKIVQHLEGGIVQKILVREADIVKIGDPLIMLDDTEVGSNLSVLELRRATSEAVIARLIAEQTFAKDVVFPDDLLSSDDPQIMSLVNIQANIFADRRSLFLSQSEILEFRAEQLNAQAEGNEKQLAAVQRRLVLRTELMERMKSGEALGVIESNRLSEMQDSVIQIEVTVGDAISAIAQVKAAAGEAKLNILQLKQQYIERANTEYKQERSDLAEVEEKLNVARDRMRRTAIVAPTSGKVQNLTVTTIGSVIRPGEILMEIVPTDDTLLVDAKVAPVDVDNVHTGLETEVRFPAFKNRYSKIVLGKVVSISSDVVTSAETNQPPHYLARIKVDDDQLTDEMRKGLTAGMPADVVILTGERTVLEYITAPLTAAFSKSLREE
jgi:HlyD family type I secretion membrane fusion protein